jgi:hypothetical protein
MTEDENKEFDLLQLADEMSHKNWLYFKFLYNKKFKEAEDRIKALEAEVLRIGDVLDNVPSVFLEWPHTDKAPPEFAERLLRAWGKIAIETLRNSEYQKLLRAKYAPTEETDG